MILVSYDGSADARAAIDHVARVLPGAEATVLTVWEPQRDYDGSIGIGRGLVGVYDPDPEQDAARQKVATACAAEGAALATEAGLVAVPRTAERHQGTAETILAVAGELDASVVALGTRGLGGVRGWLLGSVSHAVVQQADRAVLIVPSRGVADQRRGVAQLADEAPEA